jgi:4-amino-4-deoxy-L-arabinose transferase-like glycosyltransferase
VASAWVRDLWAPDEPRYAQVAREIYEGGDFLVMHLCGALYPDKPPLLFWVAGFFGWLSSWSELWMRLPSIAATVATAWVTARIARRWWSELEAAWAAAIFLTTALVLELGGRLQIDPLLTILCVLALDLLTRPADNPQQRTRWLLLAGLLLGLGGLAKGPVAYLDVGLVLIAWWLLGVREQTPRVSRWVWVLVAGLAVLPVLAWALAAAMSDPRLYDALFYDQHLGRVTKADRHPGPPWKHLVNMIYLMLPWTLLVYAALAQAFRQLRQRHEPGADLGLLRAAAWLLAMVLFFSLIPPKRDLYLLPAYPAVALLAARALVQGAKKERLPGWISYTTALLMVVIGGAISAAVLFNDELPGMVWRGPLVGLPLVAGSLAALVYAIRRQPFRWAAGLAVSWSVFATVLALVVMQPVNELKSGRFLAAELVALPEKPATIPFIRVHPEAYRFYEGVPGVYATELESFREEHGDQFLGLVLVEYWDEMDTTSRSRYREIMRRKVGGKQIVVLGAQTEPRPDGAGP